MFRRKDMKLTSEDIKKIEQFNQIMQHGWWVAGSEVTEVYNRVLEKNLTSTQCSSCIRHRISELVRAMEKYKQQLAKEEEITEQPKEEKKNGKRSRRKKETATPTA